MRKELYHYTSKKQIELIMKTGYLKLTPSNLIKPIDIKLVKEEDGIYTYASALSDPVKPVVWLTDSKDASCMGIDCPDGARRKKRIRITVPMKDTYKWWVTWAKRYRMNK